MQMKCCYGQKNLGSICSILSPSPTHLSHTRNITLSRIKCERYIFIKKSVRSFIEVRHYCWLCFRMYYVYVCGYTTIVYILFELDKNTWIYVNVYRQIIIIILLFFHTSISWWFSTEVWATASLIKESRTVLSILADVNNAVVWMVSTCPLISKSSNPVPIFWLLDRAHQLQLV